MSLAQALSNYVTLNILIVMAFGGQLVLSLLLRRTGKVIEARAALKLHYAMLAVILVIVLLHPFLPKRQLFTPTAKVWSAQSIKTFSRDYTASDKGGYLSVPTKRGQFSIEADVVLRVWLILASLLAVFGGFVMSRDLSNLLKIKRNSFLIKKIGKVSIYVNDQIKVPFSYWLPRQTNVVLPNVLTERTAFKIMLAHELQHHRHGDTRWVYILWGLRLVCVLNPFVHWWNRWISEIQEFACDETLVDRKKVEAQAYARCLIEVAETAINQKYVPACATGLVFLLERNMLKRRVNNMINKTTKKVRTSVGLSFGLTMIVFMAAAAFASNGLVQDRRVSLSQAQAMALKVQIKSAFPVVVNDLVVKQLNKFIGTPEGREFMRSSLQRMENYKDHIQKTLQSYNAPEELLAVPLIESGYQNLTQEQSATYMHAAGLWQFIPVTANKYGLRVLNYSDDRLSVELSTDAAIRYLLSNWLRFKDWQLAVFAYNVGEERVQRGINETGSRDAWTLIRHGYETDNDYLAKFMAAILIMRNPESVQ